MSDSSFSRYIGNPIDGLKFKPPGFADAIGTLSDLAKTKELQEQLAADSQMANNIGITPNNQKGIGTPVDWRARLRPKGGSGDAFWKGGNALIGGSAESSAGDDYLLRPLKESGGLVWQYTPNIFVAGRANYNMAEFYGSNYPLITYNNSTPPQLVVVEDFTANTIDEARYLLGVMHFLKVATKSFYGDQAVADGMYGTPPPVFLFEYLGDHGFNKIPVVVTDYQYQLGDDVDYVPVKTGTVGDETTYVPTVSNISITLQPSYTPHKLRKKFDLNKFTTGVSYKEGFI